MSACTCEFDHERKAYVHVCTFHAPAIELHRNLDEPDRWMLAGREVTHDAAVEHAPLREAIDKALAPTGRLMVPPGRHVGKTYVAGGAEHVHRMAEGLEAVRAVQPTRYMSPAQYAAEQDKRNRAQRRADGVRGKPRQIDILTRRKWK